MRPLEVQMVGQKPVRQSVAKYPHTPSGPRRRISWGLRIHGGKVVYLGKALYDIFR